MTEKEKRDKAVDEFAAEMKLRLDEKDRQGFTGMFDCDIIDQIGLRMCYKATKLATIDTKSWAEFEKHSIDLGNFAMMAWYYKKN